MEMNFKNTREVFVHNGLKNKNLFHIFHRCHQLGESKPSFSLIFQIFGFSVSVLILRELFQRDGDEIGETEGGFCPEHAHIQKNPSFFTQVSPLRRNKGLS
jgi:hypothetical protein